MILALSFRILSFLCLVLLAVSFPLRLDDGKDDAPPHYVYLFTTLCHEFCQGSDCLSYTTPLDKCYNGRVLFPDDPSWGDVDIIDSIAVDSTDTQWLTRRFFQSKVSSCQDLDDTYELPLGECVGPFGRPRPWGLFRALEEDEARAA